MKEKSSFLNSVIKISIPVALQSMLQSSFSIIDQIMIGSTGSLNIAAVGLAGKFSSIYSVIIAAVGAVAGIMISQYFGSKDEDEVNRSFSVNGAAAALTALLFTAICVLIPQQIMGIYTDDQNTVAIAADYLRIISVTFIPLAGSTLLSTMLRCMEKASLPLYISIIAAIFNTGFNYLLIFGKLGFTAMGVNGAAIATVIAQCVNFILLLAAFIVVLKKNQKNFFFSVHLTKMTYKQYLLILFPILITEFLWSVGENIYASVYGHLGTSDCAAMTLTYPIQGLMIGALSGIAQAAGILIGKELGKKDYNAAYQKSKKLVLYGFIGSVILSVGLILLRGFYTDIYHVEDEVKITAQQILLAFALISPVKVLNMIIGGGVLRSGGKTAIIMIIDIIGTWGFGVPLALLSAYALSLPIVYVYFILSLEECVRLLISFFVFKHKKWMNTI